MKMSDHTATPIEIKHPYIEYMRWWECPANYDDEYFKKLMP